MPSRTGLQPLTEAEIVTCLRVVRVALHTLGEAGLIPRGLPVVIGALLLGDMAERERSLTATAVDAMDHARALILEHDYDTDDDGGEEPS